MNVEAMERKLTQIEGQLDATDEAIEEAEGNWSAAGMDEPPYVGRLRREWWNLYEGYRELNVEYRRARKKATA